MQFNLKKILKRTMYLGAVVSAFVLSFLGVSDVGEKYTLLRRVSNQISVITPAFADAPCPIDRYGTPICPTSDNGGGGEGGGGGGCP